MHELTYHELYQSLEYAKGVDEETCRKIIERFELDQTSFAQMTFGIFPNVIAKENQEMSWLFMDLCFDVLCLFQKAFGPLPSQNDMDYDWLEKQAVLFDAGLQSLVNDKHMDGKIRSKLQDRFVGGVKNNPQLGLVDFMNAAIDEFDSESTTRVPAIKTTQTMIFVVIRLFGNLYNKVAEPR